MKKLYLLVVLIASVGTAQPEYSKWIFGGNAGLDFATTTPTPIVMPSSVGFLSSEGCASAADSSGNLFLFTNGTKVWQLYGGTYHVLTSALLGNTSSAQNAVIVQQPGVANRYFIITIDGNTGASKGLYYSEFDFSGGLGTVVSLNVPFSDGITPIDASYNNTSEALTVVPFAGIYWLVAYVRQAGASTSEMLSFAITSAGILSSTPKVSFYDFAVNGRCLKISPDGSLITLGSTADIRLGAYNTGYATGMNPIDSGVYGAEFSPDSANLYYSPRGVTGIIHKIAVSAPGTVTDITVTGTDAPAALQRAIDDKIYVVHPLSGYLSVINDPNNLSAPAFGDHSVYLGGRLARSGLPQRVYPYIESAWKKGRTEIAEKDFTVYPNPSSGAFNIESNTEVESIRIATIDGRIVMDKRHIETFSTQLSLQNPQKGVYVLSATLKGGEVVQKKLIVN